MHFGCVCEFELFLHRAEVVVPSALPPFGLLLWLHDGALENHAIAGFEEFVVCDDWHQRRP